MAIRRVQMLTETTYWQSLGFSYGQPLAISAGNAIVTKLATETNPIVVQLAAQYSQTGDQISIIAYLQRIPGRVIPAGSVQFIVTESSEDGLWNPTTTQIVVGTQDLTHRWIAQIPAGNVVGNTTLKIQAVIQQTGKTYRKEIYVNHLGIYGSFFRLSQEVDFLGITKKDL